MIVDKFENLLGENISEVKTFLDCNLEKTLQPKNFYASTLNEKRLFYGINYNHINMVTDNKDKLLSITIYFKKVIDHNFYESIVQNYGKATLIKILLKEEIISAGLNNEDPNFQQYLNQGITHTKDGTFEEKPLFMVWQKESFDIQIQLEHELNVSRITFKNK